MLLMLDGAMSCCSVGQSECLSQNDFRKTARQNSSHISPFGNSNNRTESQIGEQRSVPKEKV
jgi:hypothetical protein